jgi:hypothetical protein
MSIRRFDNNCALPEQKGGADALTNSYLEGRSEIPAGTLLLGRTFQQCPLVTHGPCADTVFRPIGKLKPATG